MKTGNGHLKQTIYIRPDQYIFLQQQALGNRLDERTPRPDLSFVIREIIDKYQQAVDAAKVQKGRPKRG